MKPLILAGGARLNPMHLLGWERNAPTDTPGTKLTFSNGVQIKIGEDVEEIDAMFEDATGLTIEAGG